MAFQMSLVVDKDLVIGSDKTDFPLLFTQDCLGIPSAFWSNVIDTADGLDIRFYNDSSRTVEYDREVVFFDSTDQKVESFIKVPVLDSTTDSTFVCEVGDSTRVNDSIWDNAVGIYHLQKSAIDYSPQNNDGTVNGALDSTGKINDAYSFNDSHIQLANGSAFSDTVTISAWINLRTYPPDNNLILSPNYNRASIYNVSYICPTTSRGYTVPSFNVTPTGKLDVWLTFMLNCSGGRNNWFSHTDNNVVSLNTWHHVMVIINDFTSDSIRSAKFYVDGNFKASTNVFQGVVSPIYYALRQTRIGSQYKASGVEEWRLDGIIDELRIFDDYEPDADWVETEYNNQNDPASFIICDGGPTPSDLPVLFRRRKLNSSGF